MSRFIKNSDRTKDLVWLRWFEEPVYRKEFYTEEEKEYWLNIEIRLGLIDPIKFIL